MPHLQPKVLFYLLIIVTLAGITLLYSQLAARQASGNNAVSLTVIRDMVKGKKNLTTDIQQMSALCYIVTIDFL